jgi:hypothetical protein
MKTTQEENNAMTHSHSHNTYEEGVNKLLRDSTIQFLCREGKNSFFFCFHNE